VGVPYLDYNEVKRLCKLNAYRWTDHILERMARRNISREDVKSSLEYGEIIEEYPDDYPQPSCLILGRLDCNNPLHVVCGISHDELWMITTYYPDLTEWHDDYKTRRDAES
jgi:hypothetical protein